MVGNGQGIYDCLTAFLPCSGKKKSPDVETSRLRYLDLISVVSLDSKDRVSIEIQNKKIIFFLLTRGQRRCCFY